MKDIFNDIKGGLKEKMQTILKKPELYNLLYQDVTADINLYKVLLKDYDEVVEYGAGTGRITIPLAIEGKKIIAIDNEVNMLMDMDKKIKKMGLEEQVKIVNRDMITYTQDKKVDCVIMPLTVFNYIIDEEKQDECLRNIYKYLNKNGIIILELLTKKTFKELENNKYNSEFKYIKRLETSDGYYEYWRKTKLNKQNDYIEQKRLFRHFNKNMEMDNEEIFIWKNKYISYETIKDKLKKNGFILETAYGNCNMEIFNNDSEDLFIKARKQ